MNKPPATPDHPDLDRVLKHLFQELRTQDAREIPVFDRLVPLGATPIPDVRAWPWVTLAAAASLLLLGVSLTVLRPISPQHLDPAAAWRQLSDWQPSSLELILPNATLACWQPATDTLLTLSAVSSDKALTDTPSDAWLFLGTENSETPETNAREAL